MAIHSLPFWPAKSPGRPGADVRPIRHGWLTAALCLGAGVSLALTGCASQRSTAVARNVTTGGPGPLTRDVEVSGQPVQALHEEVHPRTNGRAGARTAGGRPTAHSSDSATAPRNEIQLLSYQEEPAQSDELAGDAWADSATETRSMAQDSAEPRPSTTPGRVSLKRPQRPTGPSDRELQARGQNAPIEPASAQRADGWEPPGEGQLVPEADSAEFSRRNAVASPASAPVAAKPAGSDNLLGEERTRLVGTHGRHHRGLAGQRGFPGAAGPMPFGQLPPGGFAPDTCPPGVISNCPPGAIETCPPEPRFPAAGPSPFAPGPAACDLICHPCADNFPDEYICDGGDREHPVHYEGSLRRGLDTEDTIGEFTDHHGRARTTPSSRVCIYAPRFAAVRTVSQLHEDSRIDEVAGVEQSGGTRGLHSQLLVDSKTKTDTVSAFRMRSRAGGLESESAPIMTRQTVRLAAHDKLLNVFQDLAFISQGLFEQEDAARLNLGLQSALFWTRAENPVIAAKIETPVEGLVEQHASVVAVVEERDLGPGQLRIVKLADRKSALPGDIIEFTIRYDNLGPREVHNVRIVDNLTPRLEYVDDSATSTRDGQLVLQDNGEGSNVLIWEFDEPLPAHSGGVVTFKARVR